jgi:hypothetical protein
MGGIMTKLGVASRTQAAGIAASRGLVEERALELPSPLPSHVGLLSSRRTLTPARLVDAVAARV